MSKVSQNKSQLAITKFRCKASGQDRPKIGVHVVIAPDDGHTPDMLPTVVQGALEALGLVVVSATLSSTGRKRRNIPVKIVCDAVRGCSSVTAAAQELGVSKAWIYKTLGRDEIRELVGETK